ncbi:VWA domain-containing protein, partial [bacterium]|nr:VWA domain-containing protein [bacterium]
MTRRGVAMLTVMLCSMAVGQGRAAQDGTPANYGPRTPVVVMPQRGVLGTTRRGAPTVSGVNVRVTVRERRAATVMEVAVTNRTSSSIPAELVLAVPDGAVLRDVSLLFPSDRLAATLLDLDASRATCVALGSAFHTTAPIEFFDCRLVRTGKFLLLAGRTRKIRITYEEDLPREGERADYVLRRSDALEMKVPWQVDVRIESKWPVATVYSPSHTVGSKRLPRSGAVLVWTLRESAAKAGDFQLSWLRRANEASYSMFAYPGEGDAPGYFLLLGSLSGNRRKPMKREVTLVLDRSASMGTRKFAQVRSAAASILASLGPGERFNLIVYNDEVRSLSTQPVPKTPTLEVAALIFLERHSSRGGSDLYAALEEALSQPAAKGFLPVVVFLTDGLPTVGETSEAAIRALATKSNRGRRRIFTFGVGVDVNTPLLDSLAYHTRGRSTYVLPNERIDTKVAAVFKQLAGPVLADVRLLSAGGKPLSARVTDLIPTSQPDLYLDEDLIVLGRYHGTEPISLTLAGAHHGAGESATFSLDPATASTANAFVPRLWASRRIGQLTEAIRETGANSTPVAVGAGYVTDPAVPGMVDEIVQLSTRFGVMTQHTAFLASEDGWMAPDEVRKRAIQSFERRAIRTRSGVASVSQSVNTSRLRIQSVLNPSNLFFDLNMRPVTFPTVQQIGDSTFYRRGGRWVDSRFMPEESSASPSETIAFGSP